MTFIEEMTVGGVNAEKTVKRFAGNQRLWEHFVRKFPLDITCEQLEEAVRYGDYHAISNLAHTLKGTSANLGFEELSDRCDSLVQAIRAEEYDRIDQLFASILESWNRVVRFIMQIP